MLEDGEKIQAFQMDDLAATPIGECRSVSGHHDFNKRKLARQCHGAQNQIEMIDRLARQAGMTARRNGAIRHVGVAFKKRNVRRQESMRTQSALSPASLNSVGQVSGKHAERPHP